MKYIHVIRELRNIDFSDVLNGCSIVSWTVDKSARLPNASWEASIEYYIDEKTCFSSSYKLYGYCDTPKDAIDNLVKKMIVVQKHAKKQGIKIVWVDLDEK